MIKAQSNLYHTKYRPDIDGLRAIAVISVVGFHAFPTWVNGGFIGVDVFFVISGYLISLIILENLDRGTFSFEEFYSRRIRRIFPALLLILTISYVLGWYILLDEEYKQLGKHILGGTSFVSNFVLWTESGYFDNASETKPLLHLWSLAVEEQFYIFYPLTLWFAWKKNFNILLITILIAGISFFLNVKSIKNDATAMFFSPQTRFWELMSGSILAWLTLYKKNFAIKIQAKIAKTFFIFNISPIKNIDEKTLNDLTSLLGLTILFYGFFQINNRMHFPGIWALVPVMGSILMISAGQNAWINKYILSSRIAIWLGLISFPLYLWHWVLLSFLHIIHGELPDRASRIIAVVLSVILSWMTYKLIERPLRFGAYGKIKTVSLLIFMIVLGLIGYVTYLKDGLPFRENAHLQNSLDGDTGQIEYHKYIAGKYFLCTPKNIANAALKWDVYSRCMQSKPSEKIDIAIIGDSHAEHLFIGIAEALPNKNVVFYIKNSSPFLNNMDFKSIYEAVIKSKSITTVILTMHWIGRYSEVPKDSTLENELIKVIDVMSASGKDVYLTDDVPVFPFDPKKCKGSRGFKIHNDCTVPFEVAKSQKDKYLNSLTKVVENRPSVKLIQIGKYLCDQDSCSMVRKNSVLYRDQNHLNINGSTFIGRRLVEDNIQLFK